MCSMYFLLIRSRYYSLNIGIGKCVVHIDSTLTRLKVKLYLVQCNICLTWMNIY